MSATLNGDIISILLNTLEVDSEPGGGGWIDSSSAKNAAAEIEILVLNSQLDLLNEVIDGIQKYGDDYSLFGKEFEIESKIKELTK